MKTHNYWCEQGHQGPVRWGPHWKIEKKKAVIEMLLKGVWGWGGGSYRFRSFRQKVCLVSRTFWFIQTTKTQQQLVKCVELHSSLAQLLFKNLE